MLFKDTLLIPGKPPLRLVCGWPLRENKVEREFRKVILHPCAPGQDQQCQKPSSLDCLLLTLSEVKVSPPLLNHEFNELSL